jgi:hypothetical protein
MEAKDGVKTVISGHLTDQVYNGGAGSNIEHQIGNALITVRKAETLKAAAKVFQGWFTPKYGLDYFNRKARKSLYRICKRF